MRRALVCVLALAGCGGAAGDLPVATPTIDMSQYGPRHAVARAAPPAGPLVRPRLTPRLEAQLRAGAIAVAGIDGAAGIRPPALATSSDATLQGLSWSAWSADGASGAGEFHVLECQPNCATGHTRTVAATVQLSDVKVCDGRRYFGRAVVKPASGPAPTSYVRAPC